MPGKRTETRIIPGAVEFREATEGEDHIGTLAGYAAVFDQEFDVWGDGTYIETIDPGAFDETLADDALDVYARVQHEGGLSVIGRTKNETLRLSTDDQGLAYEVDVPDTGAGRDVQTLVSRGDISESSFAFTLRGDQEKAQKVTRPAPGIVNRRLLNLDLHDVAPCSNAAYAGTSVEARMSESVEQALAELEASDEECERETQRQRDRQRLEEVLTPPDLNEGDPDA